MKILVNTIIIGFLFSHNVYAQLFLKDSTFTKFSIGFKTSGFFYEQKFYEEPEESVHIIEFQLEPSFTYFFHKNFGIGITGSYNHLSSEMYTRPDYYELGIFLKLRSHLYLNKRFFNRLRLYAEPGLYLANHRLVNDTINTIEYRTITIYEDYIFSDNLNQFLFKIPVGIQYNIWRDLYLELCWKYINFYTGKSISGFSSGIIFNFQ